jgi:hypothetical protein
LSSLNSRNLPIFAKLEKRLLKFGLSGLIKHRRCITTTHGISLEFNMYKLNRSLTVITNKYKHQLLTCLLCYIILLHSVDKLTRTNEVGKVFDFSPCNRFYARLIHFLYKLWILLLFYNIILFIIYLIYSLWMIFSV